MAELKTIGIPSTLIHYIDYFDWETFFKALGCNVVISKDSDYNLFASGFKYATNDQCFPVKVYYGHIKELSDKADTIFIPQLISLKKDTFSCPKIIGLPQLMENTIDGVPDIIRAAIDVNEPKKTFFNITKLCLQFTRNPIRISNAIRHFKNKFESLAKGNMMIKNGQGQTTAERNIGIIGHNYTLNDSLLNMNLFRKIEGYDYGYIASDQIEPNANPGKELFGLKEVHWDFGQHMVHAADTFSKDPSVKGIIFLTYFGCGIDAFVEEVFRDTISKTKPYLSLAIDEHTAEAGTLTRIEAFLDMIQLAERRNR